MAASWFGFFPKIQKFRGVPTPPPCRPQFLTRRLRTEFRHCTRMKRNRYTTPVAALRQKKSASRRVLQGSAAIALPQDRGLARGWTRQRWRSELDVANSVRQACRESTTRVRRTSAMSLRTAQHSLGHISTAQTRSLGD